MGILDLKARVVTEYRADTSQQKAALKELQGEEKKLAEARLKATEEANKQLEKQSKRLQLAAAFASTFGKEIGDITAKVREMTGIPIGGSGTALGFMVGGGFGAVAGTLGELIGTKLAEWASESDIAITKLATGYMRAVEQLGAFEDGLEKARLEHQKLMRQMEDADPLLGGTTRILNAQADAWQKAAIKVLAYGNALAQVQASRVSQNARAKKAAGFNLSLDALVGGGVSQAPNLGETVDDVTAQRGLRDAQLELDAASMIGGAAYADIVSKRNSKTDRKADADRLLKAGLITRKEYDEYLGNKAGKFKMPKITGMGWGDLDLRYSTQDEMHGRQIAANQNQPSFDQLGAMIDKQKELLDMRVQVDQFSSTDNFLTKTFGPIEQIDAYKTAFDGFGTVVTSAFDAWIDGTMGIGKAAKIALSGVLKNLALEAAMNSLKSFAQAATYAATPGMQFWVPGALKSGALWAGLAIAAGGAAKGLGGSGGGTSAPSSSAPSVLGGGSSGASQGTAAVIVYGDQFAEDSPHERQLKAKRMVDRALGGRQAVRAA